MVHTELVLSLTLVIVLYINDFKLSMKFFKKNPDSFRRYESNKALVWTMEQFTATKNKQHLSAFHTISLANVCVVMFLIPYFITWFISINYLQYVIILSLFQASINFVGILSSIVAIMLYGGNKDE